MSRVHPRGVQRLLNVNYIGSVFATRAVIRGMKERQRGSVVFVSSQAGQMGVFGFSGYCASKFALRGLAEALQMEVRDITELWVLINNIIHFKLFIWQTHTIYNCSYSIHDIKYVTCIDVWYNEWH